MDQESVKALSKHTTLQDDIFVSNFEGLSLKEYRNAREVVACKDGHLQPCNNCIGFIKVADAILAEGFIKLRTAFTISSPTNNSYKAADARRKLLRMPLACLGVGDRKKGNF